MGISTVSGGAVGVSIDITPFDAREAAQVPDGDPDALYRDRETLASATRAAEVWAARLAANARDFESAWKLARARYWLGTNGLPEAERRNALEQGIAAGTDSRRNLPATAGGSLLDGREHGGAGGVVWNAAGDQVPQTDQGITGEGAGARPGIPPGLGRSRPGPLVLQGPRPVRRQQQQVGGHLRKALGYNQNSVITHVFLAETLDAQGKGDAARQEVRAALDAPLDPDWTPEDRRFKQQAEALLKKLSR